MSHGVDKDEAAANAKLIAAAPEMLKILNFSTLALGAAIENAKASGDNSFIGYGLTLDSINHLLLQINS